jgi:hypothetical protein
MVPQEIDRSQIELRSIRPDDPERHLVSVDCGEPLAIVLLFQAVEEIFEIYIGRIFVDLNNAHVGLVHCR